VNEDIYREEQERIFCKSWLFIGHESQIPNTGDYFTSRMGEESVVMVKDQAGKVRVFLNSCRHRGMKVCRYDEGNTRVFTCPYHGWGYGLNGALIGVPRYADAYFGELDRPQFGLLEARVCNHRGMVWATWDKEGPDFYEYMGDFLVFHDAMLEMCDGSDGEIELLPGIQKWVVPCNWKFPAENSIGDLYHNPSHASVEAVGIGPGGRGQTRHGFGLRQTQITSFPETGHGTRGTSFITNKDDPTFYPFPSFNDPNIESYFRDSWERWKQKKGTKLPPWLYSSGGNIFPNMNYHPRFPWTIMVAHPAGPMQTEMWRWYIVQKSMPDEVKLYLRQYLLRYSGPGGMTEQDDMENWSYATSASNGAMARRLPYNLQQGLGHHKDSDTPLKGARYTDVAVSEVNAMTFYSRWQDMMDAPAQAANAGHNDSTPLRRRN
jgi:phenylpropionate dioxygenase-like ring-hydroxylating dioxygenase large terminal subunit